MKLTTVTTPMKKIPESEIPEAHTHYLGTFEVDATIKKVLDGMEEHEVKSVHESLLSKNRFTAELLRILATKGNCTVKTRLKWAYLTCAVIGGKTLFHAGNKRVSEAVADERLETTTPKNLRMAFLLENQQAVESYEVYPNSVDVTMKNKLKFTAPTVFDALKAIHDNS